MRLIDAEFLYERILDRTQEHLEKGETDLAAECIRMAGTVCAVPAVEVAHGRWVDNGIPESMLSRCSVCGFLCGAYSFNYCPHCGAKMDGDWNGC